MSGEWKAGDVAMTKWGHFPAVLAMRLSSGSWVDVDGAEYDGMEDDLDIRPLVVIDAENAEDVERLAACIDPLRLDAEGIATALREFARPRSPQDTHDRYCIVRDADGTEWAKVDEVGFCWQRLGQPSTEGNAYSAWGGLAHPVEVVSP